MLKRWARSIIIAISWALVRRFVTKHRPIVVGVVGSVGKSGTKRAIAHVLSSSKRVAWQDGNYNDLVSVPLVFFGLQMPSLFNPFAWIRVFTRMVFTSGLAPEVVVLELGTDGPGQIASFGKYIQLDIAVVTAINYEHMEFFGSLQAVAKEELSVFDFAKQLYVAEDVMTFIPNPPENLTIYGGSKNADAWSEQQGQDLKIHTSKSTIKSAPKLNGKHQFAALTVAAEIAEQLDINPENIASAVASLLPMSGRMNILPGKDGSQLIDDTYNASPSAVKTALEYLYGLPQKNKIAVLGNMNEMGSHAADLHRKVARFCDPKKLTLLITIGKEANSVLAPVAEEAGCHVQSFDNPTAIGEFLAKRDLTDTAVLFKGSQNGVYLEEALKMVLKNPTDSTQLVRQSEQWLKRKRRQFGSEA